MYAHGDGVRPDAGAAMRWMQAVATRHEPSAEHELRYVYEYGHSGSYTAQGIDYDWDRAANLWHEAASQGLAAAEFDFGRAYQYDMGARFIMSASAVAKVEILLRRTQVSLRCLTV